MSRMLWFVIGMHAATVNIKTAKYAEGIGN